MKKRNPPDSTTRNVRAANKRIAALAADLAQTKALLAMLVQLLSEALPGEQPLSKDNATQIQARLK